MFRYTQSQRSVTHPSRRVTNKFQILQPGFLFNLQKRLVQRSEPFSRQNERPVSGHLLALGAVAKETVSIFPKQVAFRRELMRRLQARYKFRDLYNT